MMPHNSKNPPCWIIEFQNSRITRRGIWYNYIVSMTKQDMHINHHVFLSTVCLHWAVPAWLFRRSHLLTTPVTNFRRPYSILVGTCHRISGCCFPTEPSFQTSYYHSLQLEKGSAVPRTEVSNPFSTFGHSSQISGITSNIELDCHISSAYLPRQTMNSGRHRASHWYLSQSKHLRQKARTFREGKGCLYTFIHVVQSTRERGQPIPSRNFRLFTDPCSCHFYCPRFMA